MIKGVSDLLGGLLGGGTGAPGSKPAAPAPRGSSGRLQGNSFGR